MKVIAKLYEKGEAIKADQSEANHWWLLAAQKGDVDAKIETADKYLRGEGVVQDFTQAKYWCDEAAKDKDHRAYYCLGLINRQGLGQAKNPAKAREWFQRGNSEGNVSATSSLAQMYSTGEGGSIDRPRAWFLYFQIVRSGDRSAMSNLVELRKQMDKKEWSRVEKLLKDSKISLERASAVLGSPLDSTGVTEKSSAHH
jgi:hypothetical protein